MELLLLKITPFLKEFLPWIIVLGGVVNWLYQRKDISDSANLSKIEMLSKVEERLRESLEKQLQITEAKLDIANKEIERMKLLLSKYEIEVTKLKAELAIAMKRNPNP